MLAAISVFRGTVFPTSLHQEKVMACVFLCQKVGISEKERVLRINVGCGNFVKYKKGVEKGGEVV
ncbi:MAG: hypothetical protein PUG71_03715 [bacterium]|nr:hypothetical protein [bacterium]